MLFTLVAPLVLLAIVLAFAIVRTAINANLAKRHHPPASEVSWHEEFVAREHQAAKKATATAKSNALCCVDDVDDVEDADSVGPRFCIRICAIRVECRFALLVHLRRLLRFLSRH